MNYKSLDDSTNNHTFVYTLSGMTNFTGMTTAFGSYPSVTIPDWRSREGGLIKVETILKEREVAFLSPSNMLSTFEFFLLRT